MVESIDPPPIPISNHFVLNLTIVYIPFTFDVKKNTHHFSIYILEAHIVLMSTNSIETVPTGLKENFVFRVNAMVIQVYTAVCTIPTTKRTWNSVQSIRKPDQVCIFFTSVYQCQTTTLEFISVNKSHGLNNQLSKNFTIFLRFCLTS